MSKCFEFQTTKDYIDRDERIPKVNGPYIECKEVKVSYTQKFSFHLENILRVSFWDVKFFR